MSTMPAPPPRWIDATHMFWYINENAGENTYTLINADKRKSSRLFDHNALATALSDKTGAESHPGSLRAGSPIFVNAGVAYL